MTRRTTETLARRVPKPGTIRPEEYESNGYLNLLVMSHGEPVKHRLMIGVPMTGLIRAEWAMARWGQVIPTNWSATDVFEWMHQVTPLGYNVADARNMLVDVALQGDYEWLLTIDSDVILPPDAFMKFNEYIRQGDKPVVFGLYCTKSHPSEPLVYRGRGNSYYRDWKLGDQFWVDGIGMGATLISVALLRAMAADAPLYLAGGKRQVRRVFDTPQVQWTDPELGILQNFGGTEDLAWCDRVVRGGYLAKAGFPKIAKRKWWVYVDSSIFCLHITPNGITYPRELKW
jgi:hypothetical protein